MAILPKPKESCHSMYRSPAVTENFDMLTGLKLTNDVIHYSDTNYHVHSGGGFSSASGPAGSDP
jgi:hypothetical protein